jgi:hypothetical protein
MARGYLTQPPMTSGRWRECGPCQRGPISRTQPEDLPTSLEPLQDDPGGTRWPEDAHDEYSQMARTDAATRQGTMGNYQKQVRHQLAYGKLGPRAELPGSCSAARWNERRDDIEHGFVVSHGIWRHVLQCHRVHAWKSLTRLWPSWSIMLRASGAVLGSGQHTCRQRTVLP